MPSYPLYRGWYDQYGDMDVDWMNDGHMSGKCELINFMNTTVLMNPEILIQE